MTSRVVLVAFPKFCLGVGPRVCCMFGLGQTPQGASRHIAALMQEREDYEEAIRAQALRIQQLEADLAAANEQVEVQTLIG